MTQKEQARLQVLNSLLAEHMTLDQAAILIGVSTTRHTRRILAAYREKGVAAVAHGHRGRRSTQRNTRARCNCRGSPGSYQIRRGQPHPSQRVAAASATASTSAGPPCGASSSGAGLSSPRRRRPPKHRVRRQRMPREGMLIQVDGSHHPWLGGRPGAAFHSADRGGRCHRHGGRRPLLRAGGRPQLLPADPRPGAAGRHTSRTLHRPAQGLQAHARLRPTRDANPVQPGHGRVGDSDDLCPVPPGQGARRAHGGHLPGPAGN